MRLIRLVLVLLIMAVPLALGACGDDKPEVPKPHALTAEATGRYCHMLLSEHQGPKGQIHLKSAKEPLWFSSVRDTITFTLLPEEPKDIVAIYVTDMTSADWSQPGDDTWMDARAAYYVIRSDLASGMGAPEAVPFKAEDGAKAFQAAHGGEIVRFDAIPKDYILAAVEPEEPMPDDAGHGDMDHDQNQKDKDHSTAEQNGS